jgi:hypothetical protein
MTDMNVADSRLEAGLATSPSGRAELSRRSAAATVRSPWDPDRMMEPQLRTLDEIVLDRIELAFGASKPEEAQELGGLSIQTINSLQVSSRDGFVTLGGRVTTQEEKQAIQEIVSKVQGVRGVSNEIRVAGPGVPVAEP